MRKTTVLLLTVVLVICTLTSCDADMRTKLAQMMGKTNTNAWVASGIVKPDTTTANTVTAIVTNPTATPAADVVTSNDAIKDLGVVTTGTVLDSSTVASSIATINHLTGTDASNSEIQQAKQVLSQNLNESNKQVVNDTNTLTKAIIGKLAEKANDAGNTELKTLLSNLNTQIPSDATQGIDALNAAATFDLVTKIAPIVNKLATSDPVDAASLNNLVDTANTLLRFNQLASGASNVDPLQGIDLKSLLNLAQGKKGVSSRAANSTGIVTIDSDMVATLVGHGGKILASYFNAGADGSISEANYKKTIFYLRQYRATVDTTIATLMAAKKNNQVVATHTLQCTTTTGMVDYFLAVIFTELDTFENSGEFKAVFNDGTTTSRAIIESLLQSNPKLLNGTLAKGDVITIEKKYMDMLTGYSSGKQAALDKLGDYLGNTDLVERLKTMMSTITGMAGFSNLDIVESMLKYLEDMITNMGGEE